MLDYRYQPKPLDLTIIFRTGEHLTAAGGVPLSALAATSQLVVMASALGCLTASLRQSPKLQQSLPSPQHSKLTSRSCETKAHNGPEAGACKKRLLLASLGWWALGLAFGSPMIYAMAVLLGAEVSR